MKNPLVVKSMTLALVSSYPWSLVVPCSGAYLRGANTLRGPCGGVAHRGKWDAALGPDLWRRLGHAGGHGCVQAAGPRVRQPWPTSRMLTVTAAHTCMLTMPWTFCYYWKKSDGASDYTLDSCMLIQTHRTADENTEAVLVMQVQTENVLMSICLVFTQTSLRLVLTSHTILYW